MDRTLTNIMQGLLVLAFGGCVSSTAPDPPALDPRPAPPTESPAPASAPGPAQVDPGAKRVVTLRDGLVVYPDDARVELDAAVCLDSGWLEQVACGPDSREHESLVVVKAVKASDLHSALLLGGFEPGAPGRWSYDDERYTFVPPRGDRIDVSVRYVDREGNLVEEPIRAWITDHLGRHEFPDRPWVFAGSKFEPNPHWMGPGEHYVADMTGSLVGLVTFGDEVVGFSEVIADEAAVHAPEWVVRSEHVPAVGTAVTLLFTRHGADAKSSDDDRGSE